MEAILNWATVSGSSWKDVFESYGNIDPVFDIHDAADMSSDKAGSLADFYIGASGRIHDILKSTCSIRFQQTIIITLCLEIWRTLTGKIYLQILFVPFCCAY